MKSTNYLYLLIVHFIIAQFNFNQVAKANPAVILVPIGAGGPASIGVGKKVGENSGTDLAASLWRAILKVKEAMSKQEFPGDSPLPSDENELVIQATKYYVALRNNDKLAMDAVILPNAAKKIIRDTIALQQPALAKDESLDRALGAERVAKETLEKYGYQPPNDKKPKKDKKPKNDNSDANPYLVVLAATLPTFGGFTLIQALREGCTGYEGKMYKYDASTNKCDLQASVGSMLQVKCSHARGHDQNPLVLLDHHRDFLVNFSSAKAPFFMRVEKSGPPYKLEKEWFGQGATIKKVDRNSGKETTAVNFTEHKRGYLLMELEGSNYIDEELQKIEVNRESVGTVCVEDNALLAERKTDPTTITQGWKNARGIKSNPRDVEYEKQYWGYAQ